MKINRRKMMFAAAAGAVAAPFGTIRPSSLPPEASGRWNAWFDIEGDFGSFVVGAIGKYSCYGIGVFLRKCWAAVNPPSEILGPPSLHAYTHGSVFADVSEVLAQRELIDRIPEGYSWILVVTDMTTEGEIDRARSIVNKKAGWVSICDCPTSLFSCMEGKYEYATDDADASGEFVNYMFQHPGLSAEILELSGGNIVSAHVGGGYDIPRSGRKVSDIDRYLAKTWLEHFFVVGSPDPSVLPIKHVLFHVPILGDATDEFLEDLDLVFEAVQDQVQNSLVISFIRPEPLRFNDYPADKIERALRLTVWG